MDSANGSSLRPSQSSDNFDSHPNSLFAILHSTDGSALRPPPSSSSRDQLLLDSQLPAGCLEFTHFASNLASGGLLSPEKQPDRSVTTKKRTRASRRAPTTVLTTDTLNFRAMVQEFTGIPSAPSGSAEVRPRLDLFQCRYSDPPPTASYFHRLASLSPTSRAPTTTNYTEQYALLNSHSQYPIFTSQSPVQTKNIRSPAPTVPSAGFETRPQRDRARTSPEFVNTIAETTKGKAGYEAAAKGEGALVDSWISYD